MKRGKLDSGGRLKFIHVMIIVACLYLVFMASQVSNLFSANSVEEKEKTSLLFQSLYKEAFTHKSLDVLTQNKNAPRSYTPLKGTRTHIRRTHKKSDYGRLSSVVLEQMSKRKNMTVLQSMANDAWVMGLKAWKEAQEEADFTHHNRNHSMVKDNGGILRHKCPQSVSLNQTELRKPGSTILLPCGLALGSSVTVIGKPHKLTKRFRPGDQYARVMQFVIELQGLKVVDGEEPPKILHFNPRIRGDWSGRPIVELNTCYRMQWGTSQRCEGLRSSDDDAEKVDGFVKCEKWIRNNNKESKAMWWLNRFIGREMKPAMDWPYPFVEDHTFVLTIRAGLEGYHINVDGRHIASFPYRTGFVLEDATGLYIDGDIQPQFAYATSLPTMYRGVSNQRTLEMSSKWKAPSLVNGIIELFIGILSASNHFAERMAVRKTWMQSDYIKSSKVIVRFFVALNSRKDVNVQLKKEADFYGDIIIVPFIDNYELVVLKTVAICEYGIKNMSAKYIMKCDDDTFVRVDAVLKEIKETPHKNAIYMGNLNRFHRPLRVGKWAVSYEEWPEEQYPTYANGPGYIISENIAKFILAQHANNSLRLFKMEDVSMGMWVGQFNAASQIHYYHSWRFCQHGCTNDYITAHYQSPRQMICLWDKLLKGNADCCSE